jgi:hypothetical protein
MHWRWLLAAAVASALAALTVTVQPHLKTWYTPVQAYFRAPAATRALLSWGENPDERVELVSLNSDPTEQEKAGVRAWVGLLPPTAIDRLALTVDEGRDFAFDKLVLDTRSARGSDTVLTAADAAVEQTAGRAVVRAQTALGINSPPSGWAAPLAVWLLPALFLALCAPAALASLTAGRFGSWASRRTPDGCRLVAWACTLITIGYIIHAEATPVCYVGGDSNCFLWKGVNLAEHGRYDTPGEYEFGYCKLPGYAAIYALIVRVMGYNLTTLALAQAMVLCLSLFVLGRACLHYASKWATTAGLLMIAASPIQLFYARTLLSETMLVSCTLLAFACLLELGALAPVSPSAGEKGVKSRAEWGWLLGFCASVGAASLMRSNGLFLAAALPPLYLHLRRTRGLTWSALGARAAVAGLLTALPLGAWSMHNYRTRGLAAPQDMKGIMLFHGICYGGALDPRVPSLEPWYAEYSRIHARRGAVPWTLRSYMFAHDPWLQIDGRRTMARVDATLRAIADESARTNRPVYAAAMLRALNDNVWQPQYVDHVNESRNCPHNENYFTEAQCVHTVGEVTTSSPRSIYDVRDDGGLLPRLFRLWNETYLWYYRTVLVGALAAGFWSLAGRRGHPLLFTPLLLVGLNVAFYTSLIMPYGRYIQIFDAALVLQVLFAFSTLRRAAALPVPASEPAKAMIGTKTAA